MKFCSNDTLNVDILSLADRAGINNFAAHDQRFVFRTQDSNFESG